MKRASAVATLGGAVIVAGLVTGGVLVGQEFGVDDHPGETLGLEGVETGAAARDAGASDVTGARLKADGSTPKVVEPVVETPPVVDEVAPADPVVIKPRKPAPAPAPAPAPPPPKPEHDGKWGDHKDGGGDKDWGDWGDRDDKPEPPKPDGPKHDGPGKGGGPGKDGPGRH